MKDIKYIHDARKGSAKAAENNCTYTERRNINRSIDDASGIFKQAYRRWPSKQFKRWFGRSNAWSDENVKRRYKFAMDELLAKKNYTLVCCKSRKGRCRGCSGSTLAFVMVGTRSSERNTRFSYTDVKICPLALKKNRGYGKAHLRLGFTMFHELMHLTSGTTDHTYNFDTA